MHLKKSSSSSKKDFYTSVAALGLPLRPLKGEPACSGGQQNNYAILLHSKVANDLLQSKSI